VILYTQSLKLKLKVLRKEEKEMEIRIIRKIDELGRIVIPKDVRDTLDLVAGDDLEISVKDNCVVLKKVGNGNA
jgi:transcriptional pleiotropic regulator of transition state genes